MFNENNQNLCLKDSSNRFYNLACPLSHSSFLISPPTMSDKAYQHRRLHNLLLFQGLLAIKGESSPFTLVLDSVEQSGKRLIERYIGNAKVG